MAARDVPVDQSPDEAKDAAVPPLSVRQSDHWFVKLGIWAVGYDRLLRWRHVAKDRLARSRAALHVPSRQALHRRAELIQALEAASEPEAANSTGGAPSGAGRRSVSDLKIALLIPAFQMGKGGAEKVAGRLAEVLVRAGCDAHIFCRPPTAAGPPYAIDSRVRIRHGVETDESHVAQLAGDNFDLLVGFGMPGFYAGIAKIAQQLDVPFVIQECNNPPYIVRTLHGTHVCRTEKEAHWLRQAVFAHATSIRVTVPYYAESVRCETRPFVHAFYNGLESTQPRSAQPAKKLICVGAMKNETKNGLAAVRAFCEFTRAHPAWSLHLYGENNFSSEMQKLLEKYPDADVTDHGTVDDVSTIYGDAHALVIPSYDEGLPNVVVEALSFGVPCIGFADCNGVKHLIQNEETGLLLDRDAPRSLTHALEQIADPALRRRLSEGASRFAESNLESSVWEKSWLHLIWCAANQLDSSGASRRPPAHDVSNPRAAHWRALLDTYLRFPD